MTIVADDTVPIPAFVPTTIRDAFGVLTIDVHGGWAYRMTPHAHHAEPGRVMTRDYVVSLADGSLATVNVPISTLRSDASDHAAVAP